MVIWTILSEIPKIKKKAAFIFPDINSHHRLLPVFLFWHWVSQVLTSPLVQGVLHSSDDSGWTFQFGPTSFDHKWLELLKNIPRKVSSDWTWVSVLTLWDHFIWYVSFFHSHVTLMAHTLPATNQCTQSLFFNYVNLWASRKDALIPRCTAPWFVLLIFYYFCLQACPILSFII